MSSASNFSVSLSLFSARAPISVLPTTSESKISGVFRPSLAMSVQDVDRLSRKPGIVRPRITKRPVARSCKKSALLQDPIQISFSTRLDGNYTVFGIGFFQCRRSWHFEEMVVGVENVVNGQVSTHLNFFPRQAIVGLVPRIGGTKKKIWRVGSCYICRMIKTSRQAQPYSRRVRCEEWPKQEPGNNHRCSAYIEAFCGYMVLDVDGAW